MPAVAAILEWLPEGCSARAFIEVAEPGEQLPLVGRPGVEVTWLHRGDEEPGTGTRLLDAVRELSWPEGVTAYAWGGAESHIGTSIRRYLRNEVGLPRSAVSMTGYWRRGCAHGNDAEEDDEA